MNNLAEYSVYTVLCYTNSLMPATCVFISERNRVKEKRKKEQTPYLSTGMYLMPVTCVFMLERIICP